jgi:uncharacterized membrane protein
MPNKLETNTIQIATKETPWRRRMEPSHDIASCVYNWANIGLIVGLAIGIISTILIVWMGNIKEQYLRRDVANANQRAAEANEKAEKERLARMQIEEKLAPRFISQSHRDALIERLKQFAGIGIDIYVYPGGTPDAEPFSLQISSMLIEAGWQVGLSNVVTSRFSVRGIFIIIKDKTDNISVNAANLLADALISERIATQISYTIPDLAGVYSGGSLDDPKKAAILLLVGTKP